MFSLQPIPRFVSHCVRRLNKMDPIKIYLQKIISIKCMVTGNKIFDVLADSKSQTSLRSDHIRDFDRYLKLMFYVFIKLMVQWKDCK